MKKDSAPFKEVVLVSLFIYAPLSPASGYLQSPTNGVRARVAGSAPQNPRLGVPGTAGGGLCTLTWLSYCSVNTSKGLCHWRNTAGYLSTAPKVSGSPKTWGRNDGEGSNLLWTTVCAPLLPLLCVSAGAIAGLLSFSAMPRLPSPTLQECREPTIHQGTAVERRPRVGAETQPSGFSQRLAQREFAALL